MKMDAKFESEGENFDALFNGSGGEQSGKDGAVFIPHVSDEGVISWTNNGGLKNPTPVNIKGEKGDNGEGMDITGATVGQFAKITAVDDTGKPTAWEAVDMPTSGENLVTICDVTIEEEISKFSVTTYQGKPLSLSQFIMEIFIPNGTEATNLNGREWLTIDDCRVAMSTSSPNGGFYLYQDYNMSKHLKSKVLVSDNYKVLNKVPYGYSEPIVKEVSYYNYAGSKLPIGTRFIIKGVLA